MSGGKVWRERGKIEENGGKIGKVGKNGRIWKYGEKLGTMRGKTYRATGRWAAGWGTAGSLVWSSARHVRSELD